MSLRANLSHENEFVLHENKPVAGTPFQKNAGILTKTRFDTEAKGSLNMAYCIRLQGNKKEKKARQKFGPHLLTNHNYTAVFQGLKVNQTTVLSQLFINELLLTSDGAHLKNLHLQSIKSS